MDISRVERELPVQPAPTGTVTLLFTDIEGSTVRWDRDPHAMQDAVQRHDALVRAQVERHRGYVFKTVGDAFCVAFTRADDAVAAAQDIQSALDAADFTEVGSLRVRIALHSGTTHERDGDYFGPAVNRVARLLAAGHGGQTLVSGVTTELVCDRLPSDLRLIDLGVHKLKDLERPEHVYQLIPAGGDARFPALRTASPSAHNLPASISSFVGRDREVADLRALLKMHRVVTIVGSGGIGKTRAAIEVGAAELGRFPAGVWFLELAPLTDHALIPNAIAGLVGLELTAQSDPIGALVGALKTKRVLLILDNCEHLIDPVARVVAALVAGCPELSILATSRQSLGIMGEHPYRMPTLSVPAVGAAITAASALDCEAIRLFVERATALDEKFVLTDASAPVIGEICRSLDGIALAIELAAARVRVLAPVQLRARLDKRLKLLTGGSRELPARQQTLRALIDWSYDQLVPPEQRLFERLGIFVDGFTLDAVTAVCAEDGSDEFEVLDIVASLADKSLVVAEVDADPVRYRLLESTRAYALMKLDERAERGAVAARHLAYFAQLVQASEAADDRDHDSGALVAACAELGNVRAALAYAFAGPDAEIGARLLVASRQIWRRWSASAEGADRCEAAAAGGRFDAAITAQLRNVASYLAYKMGRTVVALEIAERAVPAARAAGDPAILFDALLCRALPLMFAGRVDEAEAQLAAARSALDRAPTTVQEVRLVEARGILQSWREDYAQAALAFAELARLHRSHRDVEGEINASSNLAECEHARGETQRAIAVVRGQLPNAQALGHYWNAFLLANLAGYLVAVEAIDEARIAARRAIELSITDPGAPLVMNAIEHFALTIAVGGEAERAARLLGFSEATRALHGFRRQHTELATYARLEALLARRYAPHELAALFEAGAALSPSAAAELALLTACAA